MKLSYLGVVTRSSLCGQGLMFCWRCCITVASGRWRRHGHCKLSQHPGYAALFAIGSLCVTNSWVIHDAPDLRMKGKRFTLNFMPISPARCTCNTVSWVLFATAKHVSFQGQLKSFLKFGSQFGSLQNLPDKNLDFLAIQRISTAVTLFLPIHHQIILYIFNEVIVIKPAVRFD